MAILAATVGPALACAQQLERGVVATPTGPRRAGPFYVGECSGVAATTITFVGGVREPFAHRFPIEAATRGQPFVLSSDFPADLDIVFEVGRFGREKPVTGEGVAPVRGIVPRRATHAYVCLAAGPPTGFTYRAG